MDNFQNILGRFNIWHGSFRLEDTNCIGPMGAVQSKAKISRGLASRLTATFLKVQKKSWRNQARSQKLLWILVGLSNKEVFSKGLA